jgi:anti-sigma factor RsiW
VKGQRTSRPDTMTHLSPEALAGYLDDDLSGMERGDAELHLATCAACRDELADVRRLQRRRGRRRWIVAAVPAAAAAALAGVFFRTSAPVSPVRAGPAAEAPLGVVSPASLEVDSASIAFIWRSLGPRATYTFTLQQADGRVIASLPATDTVMTLPDSVIGGGRIYFWFVDGMLPDGRSRSTAVHRLRTRP